MKQRGCEKKALIRRGRGLLVLLLVAAVHAPAAMAAVVVTGPVDQAGFQALLDAASPGDTIKCLGGVYDFSAPGPVWLDKGLKIVAADPGDPPVFRGDGTFVTPFETGNNGFLQAQGSFIDGLTMRGLVFEDFDRTLAFTNSHDTTVAGCPLIPGAGAKRVQILDNTARNTRRFFQIFGGPADDFDVRGNHIELFAPALGRFAIIQVGSASLCVFDDSLIDHVRPVNILYHDNLIDGGNFPVVIAGGVNTVFSENVVNSGGDVGILFADDQAFSFPDDGPIALGDVKGNIVHAGVIGIIAEGPTTITGAQIKDNEVTTDLINILLDFSANGFEVKSNQFSGSAFADVILDFSTFNNVVKVAPGDVVIDDGTNNTVKTVSARAPVSDHKMSRRELRRWDRARKQAERRMRKMGFEEESLRELLQIESRRLRP